MRILLDTHAFLWFVADDPRLSAQAREIICNQENQIFLSVVSGWEIAIKVKNGRLRLPADPQSYVVDRLAVLGIDVLLIQMSHALHVYKLPDHHPDPFDRLLVAQCQLENLPIVTADPQIARYPVTVVW